MITMVQELSKAFKHIGFIKVQHIPFCEAWNYLNIVLITKKDFLVVLRGHGTRRRGD